jgi:hypothetical protein
MTKPQRKFKLPAVLAEWWQNLCADELQRVA